MNGETKDFQDAWQEFLTEAFGFGQSAASKRKAQRGPVNLKNIGVADAEAEGPQFEEGEFPADGLRMILRFMTEIGLNSQDQRTKILEELEEMLAEQKLTIKEEFVPDTEASSMKLQAARLGDRNRASFIWDEVKFPELSKFLFQLHGSQYDNYVKLMELFITAGFSIKSVNAVDYTLNRMQQHAPGPPKPRPAQEPSPKPQPAQEPSPEEAPGDDETQNIPGRGTDEEEHDIQSPEKSLSDRAKDVLGGLADLGSLASFFPGPGQIIGGGATAASLINNLTYDPPKYAWALVDVVALSLSAIPGGAAMAKSPKIIKLFGQAKKASQVAKAATGVNTIKQELKDGLAPDLYEELVKKLLTVNDDGQFIVEIQMDKIGKKLRTWTGNNDKIMTTYRNFETAVQKFIREEMETPEFQGVVAAHGEENRERLRKNRPEPSRNKIGADAYARQRDRFGRGGTRIKGVTKEGLPESLNESKTIERWKTLAGIK